MFQVIGAFRTVQDVQGVESVTVRLVYGVAGVWGYHAWGVLKVFRGV